MKWLSWTNVILGLWLIAAPFALGYASVGTAVAEDVILGVIVAAFALWRVLGPETSGMRSVSWIVMLAGLWVLVAPFAIGYTVAPAAVANDVFIGFVILILGGVRAVMPAREVPVH